MAILQHEGGPYLDAARELVPLVAGAADRNDSDRELSPELAAAQLRGESLPARTSSPIRRTASAISARPP